MMSCAKGRALLVHLLIVVTVCRCSPVPASGPGIEIRPAEFSVDGQPNYILVGDKGGSIMDNQRPPNKPTMQANPQPQYQQQPQYQEIQYYQPQYPEPQYQHAQYQRPHQYQRPQEVASYHGPVEFTPDQYHPYGNRLSYQGSPGLTSLNSPIGGQLGGQPVIRPLVAGAALLGAAGLLFG